MLITCVFLTELPNLIVNQSLANHIMNKDVLSYPQK